MKGTYFRDCWIIQDETDDLGIDPRIYVYHGEHWRSNHLDLRRQLTDPIGIPHNWLFVRGTE